MFTLEAAAGFSEFNSSEGSFGYDGIEGKIGETFSVLSALLRSFGALLTLITPLFLPPLV